MLDCQLPPERDVAQLNITEIGTVKLCKNKKLMIERNSINICFVLVD